MGSIWKNGNSIRASVFCRGIRKTKSFATKTQAKDWIAYYETQIKSGALLPENTRTVGELWEYYKDNVTSKKRGGKNEIVVLNRFLKLPIADKRLKDISRVDMVMLRDDLIAKGVSGSGVRRYFSLLRHTFTIAIDELQWIITNPCSKLSLPKSNPERNRIATNDEINALLKHSGFNFRLNKTDTAKSVAMFLFVCKTGLRTSEAKNLEWSEINNNIIYLSMTKNGDPREVPLSRSSIKILNTLDKKNKRCFNVNNPGALFNKVCKRAKVDDLIIHDGRHMFITEATKYIDVLTLAKIVGHRNIKQLMTYYNPKTEEILQNQFYAQ